MPRRFSPSASVSPRSKRPAERRLLRKPPPWSAPTGQANSSVTGDAGSYVLGKTLAGGSEELARWLLERQSQNFDAVFVPAGARGRDPRRRRTSDRFRSQRQETQPCDPLRIYRCSSPRLVCWRLRQHQGLGAAARRSDHESDLRIAHDRARHSGSVGAADDARDSSRGRRTDGAGGLQPRCVQRTRRDLSHGCRIRSW